MPAACMLIQPFQVHISVTHPSLNKWLSLGNEHTLTSHFGPVAFSSPFWLN
jgi:hypothetical protein